MALSVNNELSITKQSNLFASAAGSSVSPSTTPTTSPSDIIKGDELSRVAREILSGAQRKTAVAPTDVKIFTQGANVDTVKQVATNRTGFDVTLSQDAMQAINSLKAQAAQNQVQNLTPIVDGKIHINADKFDISESKSIFNLENYRETEVSQSSSLYKDRKGPGGLFVPFQKDEENDNKKGLSLII